MLTRFAVASLALALLVPPLRPAPVSAQVEIAARAATITFGGRLHMQYAHSSMDAADNDFLIRRARMIAEVRVNDFMSGRVQPDFAGGGAALKDAYVSLDFSEAFELTLGQFKRPFDIFELASSTDLSLIERDGRVEGLSACAGVGSICSYSRFTEALGYSDRDLGVRVSGASGTLGYQASLTNGTGADTPDENDRKSVSGRVTWSATDRVRVSGQIGLHDYVDAAGDATAVAFGGDVEVGTWREGLHVQAAFVAGDNWRALDPQLDPATFLTWQAVASYYHPLAGDRIAAVEPLARMSWGDPDRDADDDGGILLTPGVMLYVLGRNRIGVNLDYYAPQSGSSELSLKVQSYLYF
jgi:hypothetical protein